MRDSRCGAKWTVTEDAELRRLHATGHKPSEIAVRMGRTVESVKSRAERIGIGPSRRVELTKEELDAARKLVMAGHGATRIAKELGISHHRAERLRKATGIPRGTRRFQR